MSTIPNITALTHQHRKFVEGLSEGLTQEKAAIRAGFSGSYGKDLARVPQIKTLLMEKLEEKGLNEDKIADKLAEGLDAMAPPRKDGGTLYPDNFVRKQYLDLLCRIRGDYAPEKSEHTEKTIQITLDLGMLKSLKDSGMLSKDDADILEAEIVEPEPENAGSTPKA